MLNQLKCGVGMVVTVILTGCLPESKVTEVSMDPAYPGNGGTPPAVTVPPSIAFSATTFSFTLNSAGSTTGVPVNTGGVPTRCTVSPALPAGLSVSTATCAISGTPTALAPATQYSVTASNASGSDSVKVISIEVVNTVVGWRGVKSVTSSINLVRPDNSTRGEMGFEDFSSQMLAIDSLNQLYVAGFANLSQIAGGPVCSGEWDLVVSSFDSSGNKRWAVQIGVSPPSPEQLFGVRLAPAAIHFNAATNQVYVVSRATGGGSISGVNLGMREGLMVVHAFSASSGTLVSTLIYQAQRLGGSDGPVLTPYAMATDSVGSIYLTGSISEGYLKSENINPPSSPPHQSALFIIKLDATGAVLWEKVLNDQSVGRAISLMRDGVIVAGNVHRTMGATAFDGIPLSGSETTVAFVTKYDFSGVKRWTTLLGSGFAGSSVSAHAIASDSSGNSFVAGQSNLSSDWASVVESRGFVTKLNYSTGTVQSTLRLSVTNAGAVTSVTGIGLSTAGKVLLSGEARLVNDANQTAVTSLFFSQYHSDLVTLNWQQEYHDSGISNSGVSRATLVRDTTDDVLGVFLNDANDYLNDFYYRNEQDLKLIKYSSNGVLQ